MSDYLNTVVNKEEFDISDKIGISDIIDVYTEYYPLLRLKKIYNYDKYQVINNSSISLNMLSGNDFLEEEYFVSYLNLPIDDYQIFVNFSSTDGLYYNAMSVAAISGSFNNLQPVVYDELQYINIGSRTRFKLADKLGMTLNIPAILYSGDSQYCITPSGNIDTQFYPVVDADYFINESIENGEVVLKPSAGESIKSYNLVSDNYSYDLDKTYYVSNNDLLSGALNKIIIDELGNSIDIYYSGFDNLTNEIPFYIGDNDRYFKLFRQDDASDRTTRSLLVEGTDYKIDYNNGKIKFYSALEWTEDTQVWIESYVYDKIYYKYISSTRFEIGDTDSTNFQFSHSQLRKIFHKALQKILFWIPLNYSSDEGYIIPRLDAKMLDFVSELSKIIALQNITLAKASNAIDVADGDSKISLSAGLPSIVEINKMNLKEAEKKIRSAIEDYCVEAGYMNGYSESTQDVTGTLF